MTATPMAKVGAPPVFDSRESASTDAAAACSCSGVITYPKPVMVSAALWKVSPMTEGGAFIERYSPGSSTQAAMMASTATEDSISMPP